MYRCFMAKLPMPDDADADVIKSPTHTLLWTDGDWRYSCCSVCLSCCGGVTTYQSSASAVWRAGTVYQTAWALGR